MYRNQSWSHAMKKESSGVWTMFMKKAPEKKVSFS